MPCGYFLGFFGGEHDSRPDMPMVSENLAQNPERGRGRGELKGGRNNKGGKDEGPQLSAAALVKLSNFPWPARQSTANTAKHK